MEAQQAALARQSMEQARASPRLCRLVRASSALVALCIAVAPQPIPVPSTQEALLTQLEHLPRLSEIPLDVPPQHWEAPPANTARGAAARRVHTLALAEAGMEAKWWEPLKALNEEAADAALRRAAAPRLPPGVGPWDEEDACWRHKWEALTRVEAMRPYIDR